MLPQGAALGVCLERMHRAFCEVLVLAQRHNAAATGPSRVRLYLCLMLSTDLRCYTYSVRLKINPEVFVRNSGQKAHINHTAIIQLQFLCVSCCINHEQDWSANCNSLLFQSHTTGPCSTATGSAIISFRARNAGHAVGC